MVVDSICSLSLVSSYGCILGGRVVWYFPLQSLEPCFWEGFGGVGIASLFGSSIIVSKRFDNFLIDFNWESPTWKGCYGCGDFKDFSISEAAWMAISLELKLVIFLNYVHDICRWWLVCFWIQEQHRKKDHPPSRSLFSVWPRNAHWHRKNLRILNVYFPSPRFI